MALTIEDWGRTAYADAFNRQVERVEKRLTGEIGDTLILTEHESVYTIGARHGAEKHLLLAPDLYINFAKAHMLSPNGAWSAHRFWGCHTLLSVRRG